MTAGDAIKKMAEGKPEEKKTKEVPMIVHRTPYVDSAGNHHIKEHGPMPVSEWAEYEKENGL